MFSSIDKAIVALVASGSFLFTSATGIDTGIDGQMLNVIGMLGTAAAVYFTPNKG